MSKMFANYLDKEEGHTANPPIGTGNAHRAGMQDLLKGTHSELPDGGRPKRPTGVEQDL
jgi:hypothetical protein